MNKKHIGHEKHEHECCKHGHDHQRHIHEGHDHKGHNMQHKHHCHEKHSNHMHHEHSMSHSNHEHHDHDHGGEEAIKEYKKKFFIGLVLTIFVIIFSLPSTIVALPEIVKIVGLIITSTILYFYCGAIFLQHTKHELKAKKPGMMALISLAITSSYFYSLFALFAKGFDPFFIELATLIDVMLLGHWIEAKAVISSSKALEKLAELLPEKAHKVEGNEIIEIDIKKLKEGDIVLIKPGEKIPLDGIILEGTSSVDESLLTGESKPVVKKKGQKVVGGSINLEGSLKVKITASLENTYLSKVMKLVEEAQKSKTKTQLLADKAAGLLFYIAVVSASITTIFWSSTLGFDFALKRAMAVLVITCPHALGLAIPLVVSISSYITARNGMIVKNRAAFEIAKDIDYVIFDKTGTLTEGKPVVKEMKVLEEIPYLEDLIYSLELHSEHIYAKAIVNYLKKKGARKLEVKDVKVIAGKGIVAKHKRKEIVIGNKSLMQDHKIDIKSAKVKKGPGSTIYVAYNNKLAALIYLEDEVKANAKEAVKVLQDLGKEVVIVSGDSEEAVREVAKTLKIKRYFAEKKPHEKLEIVESFKKKGLVAFVGDGVNDAAPLTASHLGIAIGAGTDVAIESADVVLVKNDPLDVAKLIKLSTAIKKKMIQNLWWAAGYNIIAIPIAAGALYWQGILLSPAVSAALMSLSTVIVAINAQTLRKTKV